MTRLEYQSYLQTEHWKTIRQDMLSEVDACQRCQLPRWLAELVYHQDLNVHHKHYRNLDREQFEDLEVLCRRCHEIQHWGVSMLRAPRQMRCDLCGFPHWNPYSKVCASCNEILGIPWLE